jgi:hypothetical protein
LELVEGQCVRACTVRLAWRNDGDAGEDAATVDGLGDDRDLGLMQAVDIEVSIGESIIARKVPDHDVALFVTPRRPLRLLAFGPGEVNVLRPDCLRSCRGCP